VGKRDRRRQTRARRRDAAAASFFAPSPDELGLRPLPPPDQAVANARPLLISAISQELRTPLNAIVGYAHLLLADTDQPVTPQQRDDLRQLQASADRLARAIDSVIELARLECGRSHLAIESTDMIVLGAEARLRIIAAAHVATSRIRLVHDPDLICADVDPMRFLDALVAIGRDLLQLSPNRSLTINVRRTDVDCVVAIAAERDENAAARPTTRRPAAALPWGTPALDIAAAARLVELLGGAIAVEADSDIGSRVVMRVPLTPDERRPLGSREARE
jgi:signal transduction histidine kinase